MNPIVNSPAINTEFMIITPAPDNPPYLVASTLQEQPSFVTANPIVRRNKQIEVGMRIVGAVIRQAICMALSCRDGSR
jgi:hypothetical protein